MRAIVCPVTGSLDDLRLDHAPEPRVGSGQIKISVRAAALNYADIMMVLGQYQEKPDLPFVPGMEVAGEVVESSEGSRFPVGSRVMATLGHGALAEFAVAEEGDTLPIPAGMDWAAAASFPLVYGTAHLGLTYRALLDKGELLVVTGAGGGVGLAAVDVGKALGADVVAITSGGDKAAAARSRGADHLINHREEDVRSRLKELVRGRSQVYFDSVGGSAFEACLRAAGAGARLMVVGFAGAEIQKIPANILLVKNVSVIGYYWGAYRTTAPALVRDSFSELLEWIGVGRICPRPESVVPFAEAIDALRDMREARSVGKVVVTW